MYNTLKEIQDALSNEDQIKYAEKAVGKTAEEIIEMFKRDNIEISIEAAMESVDSLKGIETISNEELEDTMGGCGSKPVPRYHVGQRLLRVVGGQAYGFLTITKVGEYDSNEKSFLYEFVYDNQDTVHSDFLEKKPNTYKG